VGRRRYVRKGEGDIFGGEEGVCSTGRRGYVLWGGGDIFGGEKGFKRSLIAISNPSIKLYKLY